MVGVFNWHNNRQSTVFNTKGCMNKYYKLQWPERLHFATFRNSKYFSAFFFHCGFFPQVSFAFVSERSGIWYVFEPTSVIRPGSTKFPWRDGGRIDGVSLLCILSHNCVFLARGLIKLVGSNLSVFGSKLVVTFVRLFPSFSLCEYYF